MKKIFIISICAFVCATLLAACDSLEHEHTYGDWTRSADGHFHPYSCGCPQAEIYELHIDEDKNGECDACKYYVGKPHKYHDYYWDINEDSHMKIFTCGCVSEGFEPHYNNDGDEYCDACDWNMVGHIHTSEKYQDESGHGWYYTCGCDTPPNFAQHFDGDDNGKCDGCEYQTRTVGLVYEKDGKDSYSVVGFLGDEDGIVEIPDYYKGLPVRYIRGNAFYGAEVITELIVGDNVLVIEGNAFMLCSNLEKVTLGNSLTLIDMQAFFGCEKLEEITIPATVTFIGFNVFKNCSQLKSIIFESPEGWYIRGDINKIHFSADDMSDAETVVKYFTDTYVSNAWWKD